MKKNLNKIINDLNNYTMDANKIKDRTVFLAMSKAYIVIILVFVLLLLKSLILDNNFKLFFTNIVFFIVFLILLIVQLYATRIIVTRDKIIIKNEEIELSEILKMTLKENLKTKNIYLEIITRYQVIIDIDIKFILKLNKFLKTLEILSNKTIS